MDNPRVIRAFLRSTPSGANWIGALTLVVWLIKAVVLDGVTAPFPWMAGIGTVVDGLFSAVIAGYVFYVLFALWPDFQARKTLSPYVNGKAQRIVGDCMGVLDEINRATSGRVEFKTATDAEIIAAFTAVQTNVPPRLLMGTRPATWFEFLQYRRQRTLEATSQLINRVRFLEPDLVSLLSEIEECSYFAMVAMTGGSVSNPNLSAWASSFVGYLAKIRALARWHDDHRPPGSNPLI